MQTVGGIFGTRESALHAVEALHKAGVAEKNIDVLMPGGDAAGFAEKAHTDEVSKLPGAWGALATTSAFGSHSSAVSGRSRAGR